MTAGICEHCGGPCPESKNPARPRKFCRNACRAAWRQDQRNAAVIQARDAVQAGVDAMGAWKVALERQVDALNDLVIQPRKRKGSS